VPEPLKLSGSAPGQFWEIPVLFEDEHLLALDKPAVLATTVEPLHPDRPGIMRLLHEAILARRPWVTQRGIGFVMNAWRLDAETSGVLLLARSRPVLVRLANAYSSGHIRQTWLALSRGTLPRPQLNLHDRIGPDPRRAGLMRVTPEGMQAQTRVELAEGFAGVSLFRCHLTVARTHQIRVHLRHARLPVFGDRLYACHTLLLSNLKPGYRLKPKQTERPLIDRAAVHCERVELEHPVTGAALSFTAPLPRDFNVAIKYLRRYAGALAPAAPTAGTRPAP
jgi:23S rRNA pseudouridine1911/1915/1917 synthase